MGILQGRRARCELFIGFSLDEVHDAYETYDAEHDGVGECHEGHASVGETNERSDG